MKIVVPLKSIVQWFQFRNICPIQMFVASLLQGLLHTDTAPRLIGCSPKLKVLIIQKYFPIRALQCNDFTHLEKRTRTNSKL